MADNNVNLSINGQSQVPPGFRFHPTEEELLHYYLRKKVSYEKIDLDVIREVDLNKLEPWDIQEKCRIGSTPQNDWYFFSHKDKKYPTGTRTNRATAAGFWKATGRDKIIYSGLTRIGLRKTLVFYKGRAPHGQKSDWIMHEYRLDDNSITLTTNDGSDVVMADSVNCNEEGWVVCRVFKKKNYQKIVDSPNKLVVVDPETQTIQPGNNGVLDQILLYMGRSSASGTICKSENQTLNNSNITGTIGSADDDDDTGYVPLHERFMHLPRLETVPKFDSIQCLHEKPYDESSSTDQLVQSYKSDDSPVQDAKSAGPASSWASLERLVAWQLNHGHHQVLDVSDHKSSSSNNCPIFEEDDTMQRWNHWHNNDDMDIWSSLTESSSSPSSLDPLRHLSV